MLLDMRDKAQSWIAWAIVILISITFAFWGINYYFNGDGKIVVAEVNGEVITYRDYQNKEREYRQSAIPAEILASDTFREAVLEELINEELIRQHLDSAGYAISNEQVQQVLASAPDFKGENGSFDIERYKQAIRNLGISEEQFEESTRQKLRKAQFDNSFSTTVFPYEADKLAHLAVQQRTVRELVLPPTAVTVSDTVSDEEIQVAYNKAPENYIVPEAVKLHYVELKISDLQKNIAVDDDTLTSLYEQQLNRFKTVEQRQLRHIMFNGDSEEARQKAEAAKQQLDTGADFAELAKTQSEDTATAPQGGDMGYFIKKDLEPAIADALFSLKTGEIAGPIKSEFGYHIIRLDAIKPSETKPFAAVRDLLLAEEQQRLAEEKFYDAYTNMANLAYEQPDSLEPVANALKLNIQESDWITRTPPADANNPLTSPAVLKVAFGEPVLVERQNSELIEITPEHKLIIRLKEHRPKQQQKLDAVRDKIKASIIQQRTIQALDDKARALIARLKAGDSAEDVATSVAATWSEAQTLTRNLHDPLTQETFRMSEDAKYHSYHKTAESTAIIALDKVENPEVDAEQTRNYQNNLRGLYAKMHYSAFLSELHQDATIEKNLKAILDQ
jgi:peptidyl-prolyl cis-trans isomerase D